MRAHAPDRIGRVSHGTRPLTGKAWRSTADPRPVAL
jgi:hypothetical protein